MNNINNGYKQFEVTFTENKKYRAATRTIEIGALNNYQAEKLTHQTFGSFKSTHPVLIPSNRIKVDSCIEIKEVKEEVNSEKVVNA